MPAACSTRRCTASRNTCWPRKWPRTPTRGSSSTTSNPTRCWPSRGASSCSTATPTAAPSAPRPTSSRSAAAISPSIPSDEATPSPASGSKTTNTSTVSGTRPLSPREMAVGWSPSSNIPRARCVPTRPSFHIVNPFTTETRPGPMARSASWVSSASTSPSRS